MKSLVSRSFFLGTSVIVLLGACSPPPSQEEVVVVAEAESAVEAAYEEGADTAMAAEEEAVALVEYLFVQYAAGVRLADGKLFLDGVSESILFFSDRPHRIVGRGKLDRFLEAWDQGDTSFRAVPPNAVVTVVRDEVSRDAVVVLRNPVLDGNTLVYDVDVLEGPESGEGQFAAVFIDGLGRPLRGGEAGIPGAEVGRPGRPGDPVPGAEIGKPGRPDANISGKAGIEANPKGRKMLKAEAADRIF